MPDDLDKIYILPKMRSEKEARHNFQLIWNLNLQVTPSRCLIALLFRNVMTGYYLIDTISPELLSYCTIGSHFIKGKKNLKKSPVGTVRRFTINSSEHNRIVAIEDALNDSEFDLSLTDSRFAGDFTSKVSSDCKSQMCLVYHDKDTKVVIPCSVLAGAYYFKSTSLREAVFSRKLSTLYEDYDLDSGAKHANITLKPGAADSDAKEIVRFLSSEFGKKRMAMISNHLNASKGKSQQLIADFPVAQELTIRARGHLASNPHGGKTFVVFQILEENSSYPFESIEIDRRKYENDVPGDNSSTFPASTTKPGKDMTTNNPISRYIRKILQNHVSIENPNLHAIQERKKYIPTPREENSKTARLVPSDEDVQLSTQQDSPSGDQSVGKANVEREDDQTPVKKTGYEMSLDEFEQMVERLKGRRQVDEDGISRDVTNFSLSRQTVWQRKRSGRMRLTLREVYKGKSKEKRECLYVSFVYDGKNACLVEIDQTDLPGGCSTYLLLSRKFIKKKIVQSVVKDYVEGETLAKTQKGLKSGGILLESKHHPRSNSDEHQDAWCNRLLEVIAACASV